MVDSTGDSDLPICGICNVDDGVIECSGQEAHAFCRECFEGYARVNFELNGEYERERDRGGLVSNSGGLPCPHFIQGACNCTEIAPSLLRRFVDDEAFRSWRQADVRLGMAESQRESDEAEARRQAVEEQLSPVENLRQAVLEAFTKGGTVCCPECSAKGEKDDQCMHIRCQSCATDWCYCCGRKREDGGCHGSNKCDAESCYLENSPGWDSFGLDEETQGQGALHEFHRRRVAYFLRHLKQNTGDSLWTELRATYPDLLTGVPTEGRSIDWDSLDDAMFPVFGTTARSDVKWASDWRDIIDDLEERRKVALDNILNQTGRRTILQRRFARYVESGVSRLDWLWVVLHFLALFALFTACIAVENELAKLLLGSGLCLLIVYLLARNTSSAIDARYTILSNQEDETLLPYAEVQFCGTREELPYLSRAGRWRRLKWLYLVSLFACLSFGIFLTVFFRGWSEARCISYYGVCGIGPALLVYGAMVFGVGTLFVNLSPPPESRRGLRMFGSHAYFLYILGGVMMPVGTYFMIGFPFSSSYWFMWAVGAALVWSSASVVLTDLSQRCLNPRGFAVSRGGVTDKAVLFWAATMFGLLLLRTADTNVIQITFGCILSVCPSLYFLIQKYRAASS